MKCPECISVSYIRPLIPKKNREKNSSTGQIPINFALERNSNVLVLRTEEHNGKFQIAYGSSSIFGMEANFSSFTKGKLEFSPKFRQFPCKICLHFQVISANLP